jgi:hypothetical protein
MQQMVSSDDHSLKVVLWITGIGCLIAVPFIFLPWSVIEAMASFFGHDPMPDVPIVVYYIKVLFGAWGFIGIFFIILARNPLGYGPMLYLGAYGLIVLGLLELILGIIIDVSPIVYIGDVSFALILGIIILVLSLKLTR